MRKLLLALLIIIVASGFCFAQTSAFNYQGKLASSGAPANGDYQFEFKLFDASNGTNQIGVTQTVVVTVQNGAFTTRLDFGANAFAAGHDRWLEISVRLNHSGDDYRLLSPRQQINSTPFAVRSLTATTADSATTADTATTAQNVSGVVSVANGGTGSATQNFVDLTSNQSGISGDKTFVGALSGNVVAAVTQFNIGGQRMLSSPGAFNTFVGRISGAANTGGNNAFFGDSAGFANTAGERNAFFGANAGQLSTTGSNNAFFGDQAGFSNGAGSNNAFFGANTGRQNMGGTNNTIIGSFADVGALNLNFATAVGSGAVVSSSNTIVLGRSNDTVQIPGNVSVLGTTYRFNPQLLSLLRWDLLLPANNPLNFAIGPSALAFDGTFIYVAQIDGDTVSRIRASTGIVEGSAIPVGDGPASLAFDGTFMYVSNFNSGNVYRIRASTGLVEGSPISVGSTASSASGLAFDGTFMYVATGGTNVIRIRTSTGLIEGSPIPVGGNPLALAFDGTFMYVATINLGHVVRIRASTGIVEGNPIAAGSIPSSLAFDGTFMYVGNGPNSSATVTRIRASSGVIEGSPIAVGNTPTALAFDGTFMYVSYFGGVTRIRSSAGIVEGSQIALGNQLQALAFDGAFMYVADQFNKKGNQVLVSHRHRRGLP